MNSWADGLDSPSPESRPPGAIPARAVRVAKLHRAECAAGDCQWKGNLHGDYQAANDERIRHLDDHRAGRA